MDLTQFPTEFPKLMEAIQENKKDLATLNEEYYPGEYPTMDDMLVDMFYEALDIFFEEE